MARSGDPAQASAQRLDKWLWQARFFRTRTVATAAVSDGMVRVNGERAMRPAQAVRAGDTLTFVQGGRVRVVRIVALAVRRGPAAEAATLYRDIPTGAGSGPVALE
ncbi:MAG: RNA-binding S4 domain-containing protein [Gemmobacter sp.]